MQGKEFKKLRIKMGLTQVRLAERLGVASNSVARWEQGVRAISEPMARFIKMLVKENTAQKEKK